MTKTVKNGGLRNSLVTTHYPQLATPNSVASGRCWSLLGGVRTILPWVLLFAVAAGAQERVLQADDFTGDLSQWAVEQQPGGTVRVEHGRLVIADAAGCTVWFRPRLTAPVVITYEAKLSPASRVSDLNCFWMAREAAHSDEPPYARAHARDGRFAAYDSLLTYYVGYGGNTNSTTRFRRYDGQGARPLRAEHDLRDPRFLLIAGHTYRITLTVTAGGHVQFLRDGEVVFDFHDPQPLTSGWFAFRTVHSQMEVAHFRVSRPVENH